MSFLFCSFVYGDLNQQSHENLMSEAEQRLESLIKNAHDKKQKRDFLQYTHNFQKPKSPSNLINIPDNTIPVNISLSFNNDITKLKVSNHAISPSLEREIMYMAQANIPRETIIDHVLTHESQMSVSEASDMIVRIMLKNKKRQPREMDIKKATELDRQLAMEKLDRGKRKLNEMKKMNDYTRANVGTGF
jgi:hypothetical protein